MITIYQNVTARTDNKVNPNVKRNMNGTVVHADENVLVVACRVGRFEDIEVVYNLKDAAHRQMLKRDWINNPFPTR